MVSRTVKRAFYTLMGALGVMLTLAALFLLTQTVQKSDDFDRLQDIILAINIAGGFLLIALLIGNLTRLAREIATENSCMCPCKPTRRPSGVRQETRAAAPPLHARLPAATAGCGGARR